MHLYTQIYEFAASAGAFEGYVYHKKNRDEIDMKALNVWMGHLVDAFTLLPEDALEKFRDPLDLTLNRAMASLKAVLEKDHEVLKQLRSIIRRKTNCSPDDFQKIKWFEQ